MWSICMFVKLLVVLLRSIFAEIESRYPLNALAMLRDNHLSKDTPPTPPRDRMCVCVGGGGWGWREGVVC